MRSFLWIKLIPVNSWMESPTPFLHPLCAYYNKNACIWTSLSPLSRYSPNPTTSSLSSIFSGLVFFFLHIQHIQTTQLSQCSSTQYPLQWVCEHPAPWQTFKRTLRSYSMFTMGAIQRSRFQKTGPLLQMEPACIGIVEEMTMS